MFQVQLSVFCVLLSANTSECTSYPVSKACSQLLPRFGLGLFLYAGEHAALAVAIQILLLAHSTEASSIASYVDENQVVLNFPCKCRRACLFHA